MQHLTETIDVGETAELWLTSEFSNARTQQNYRSGLKHFIRANQIEQLEGGLDEYLETTREHNHVIQAIQHTIMYLKSTKARTSGKPYAPYSVNSYISGIKQFFEEQGIDVNRKELNRKKRRAKQRTARPVTPTHKLEKPQLRRILQFLPIHGKALALVLASSGLRVSEALGLRMDDVHFHETPVRINVRAENAKSGYQRIVFISEEAVEALNDWFAHRTHRNRRGFNGKGQPFDEKIVFDFSYSNARQMWNRALVQARYGNQNQQTNYRLYRLHTLRKFFNTEMKKGANDNYVKKMMGHESDLEAKYNVLDVEELANEYQTNVHRVEIYTEERYSTRAQDQRIHELEDQLEQLQTARRDSDRIMDALFRDEEFRALMQRKLRDIT